MPNKELTPEKKARLLIDAMLKEAGWTIIRKGEEVPSSGSFAVEEIPTLSGAMDYGLIIDNELVGDVEAKSEETGVPGILAQDERYSKSYDKGSFDFGGYHVPFIYASNGHLISFRDIRSRNSLPREIDKFHTPSALSEYLGRNIDEAYSWLTSTPIEIQGIRPYQREAIEAIENAIMSNKRRMLLAMATGTGKTFIAAEMVYRLLKSKTARRILFLVDRRVLAAQAVREFAAFEPEPAQKLDKLYEIYSQRFKREDLEDSGFDPNILRDEHLTDPRSDHTFVYVCTVQRMAINLFGKSQAKNVADVPAEGEPAEDEEDARKIPIPIHASM